MALGLTTPALSADTLETLPPAIRLARQTEDDDEAFSAKPRVVRARERPDDRATESGEFSPAADEALGQRWTGK